MSAEFRTFPTFIARDMSLVPQLIKYHYSIPQSKPRSLLDAGISQLRQRQRSRPSQPMLL